MMVVEGPKERHVSSAETSPAVCEKDMEEKGRNAL